jgi:hypothetical protein
MARAQDFDIRYHLKNRFPEFFHLLGENNINWRGVNKSFAKKAAFYQGRFNRSGRTFRIDASLYDIIIYSLRNEPEALRMFGYIKALFAELTLSTTREEKKEIAPALYGLLTNVDYNYRNFLGELSVLNLLKKNMGLLLLKTEKPLFPEEPKGVKIDFHFRQPDTNKEYLVEVVNIRLDETNASTEEETAQVLNEKIPEKLLATGINRSKAFFLAVVLWGDWNRIVSAANYYRTTKPEFENTMMPVCFIPFTDLAGADVFKFGTIDTIFEGSNAQ